MPRILRTNAATEDLVEISRRLANHPDVRVFPCERYLIFYRPLAVGDGIDVLRVLPASSDWLGALDIACP